MHTLASLFIFHTHAQTIEDHEDAHHISYIKLINVGQKVITRNCHGYLPSQVAFYLQNVHISPRKIYLSVNAEAVKILDLVGGKSTCCFVPWLPILCHSTDRMFVIILHAFFLFLVVCSPGMQSGTLTQAGQEYSRSLAEYLMTEQLTDLVDCGKEMLVLTG